MARKRKGRPIHGWLSVDKPLGMSSSAVVGRVRRLMNAEKAGHGGTLDPLATGILPVALGEATKTAGYLMDARKRYRFTVTWGEARDTVDAEGAVTARSDIRPSASQIENVLPEFLGTIEQVPPAFSALKVDGRRAYELARSGQAPDLAARQVQIYGIRTVALEPDISATFETECGKGTYVRSLAVDLAQKLGTVGYVSALRRLSVGPFTEENAITLEKLDALSHSAAAEGLLLPVETPLDDIPAVAVTDEEAARLRNGQAIHPRVWNGDPSVSRTDGLVLCMSGPGRPVALCHQRQSEIRPVRVFNLPNE